jgi:predicted nucleotidyltransferase
MTIEEVKERGLLAYEFVRGSTLYNTNIEGISDVDYGGVYIVPTETLLGLPENYEPQVSDEKHDTTYYELGRWVELLMKANPNALESLFAPRDKVVGDIHPAIQLIIDNRDLFVTKECFNSLTGYAVSQIKKCRGLNKKCVQPVLERKDVLDFCYTFKGQGSQSMKEFLAEHGLDQKYCGLVNIPNMKDVYGVYYDFAAHWKFEKNNINILLQAYKLGYTNTSDIEEISDRYYDEVFFGYSGIVHPDGKSNEVRLSSIPKGEKPICFMTYNQNGYESHCRKYKEYQEWVEKRNPIRYESNLKSNYDCKNVMHCVRLLHMGKELAEGRGFNVVRTWDRDFLLDIRNHKYEYEYIMDYVENLFEDMKQKIETCSLPETVNKDKVNELLIQARKIC